MKTSKILRDINKKATAKANKKEIAPVLTSDDIANVLMDYTAPKRLDLLAPNTIMALISRLMKELLKRPEYILRTPKKA